MLPERPNIDAFVKMINDLADVQDSLNKVEYEYKKKVANCKREALRSGKKTREVECVEYLGNTEEEGKVLDGMMQSIFDRRKAVRILWGKVEAWKSARDLYRTDSYHTVGGGGTPPAKTGGFFDAEEEN